MDDEIQDATKWPSKRVPKGGVFNLPKVKYSKETHDFLNCKSKINLLYLRLSFFTLFVFALSNCLILVLK